jgi:hypothetical protein
MALSDELSKWLIQNLSGIVYIIIGSVLGSVASWVTARYSWKKQRDEQRRGSVYAPLFDELPVIRHDLTEYNYPLTPEYDKIKSEHLLYLVPKDLRGRIIELSKNLRLFGELCSHRKAEYRESIAENLGAIAIPPATLSNDGNANTLVSDLCIFVLRGGIPPTYVMNEERLYQDVKQRFRLMEPSVRVYFQRLLSLRANDSAIPELEALKDKTVIEVEAIQREIAKDLDAEL